MTTAKKLTAIQMDIDRFSKLNKELREKYHEEIMLLKVIDIALECEQITVQQAFALVSQYRLDGPILPLCPRLYQKLQ